MANLNVMLDAVLSRVPTFGWAIVHVGQPIFHFGTPISKHPKHLTHPSEICPC